MTILSDDAVIRIGGLVGEANTISVGDLKALVLAVEMVSRYQGRSVETLEPGGVWTPSTLGIDISIDNGIIVIPEPTPEPTPDPGTTP